MIPSSHRRHFLRSTALAGFVCVLPFGTLARAAEASKISVLIIDGQNNHDYKRMTPWHKAQLEASGIFTVDVSTTPSGDSGWDAWKPDFSKYQVVLSNYNGKQWPDPIKKSFVEFIEKGGGAVIIHAANNAFSGWSEYDKMIGLGWRGPDYGNRVTVADDGKVTIHKPKDGPGAGHGSQWEFIVTSRDAEHPIMKGIPLKWKHGQDELYHGQRGPAEDMHILATAFSDKANGGTGENEPMVWWIPFGKGKVVTNVMGHVGPKTDAIQCAGSNLITLRACEWAATGKVTLPVPALFPTQEKTVILEK